MPIPEPVHRPRTDWQFQQDVDVLGDLTVNGSPVGGGGGVAFDQANEGGSFSVVASGSAYVASHDEASYLSLAADDGLSEIVSEGTFQIGTGQALVQLTSGADDFPNQVQLLSNGVASLVLNETGGSQILLSVPAPPDEDNGPWGIRIEAGGDGGIALQATEGTLVSSGSLVIVQDGTPGAQLAFFGTAGATKPTVSGATADQKITSLISALAALGLVTDGT